MRLSSVNRSTLRLERIQSMAKYLRDARDVFLDPHPIRRLAKLEELAALTTFRGGPDAS